MISIKKHKTILILLISGFLLFFLNMNFQLNFFGKYLSNSDLSIYHGIIKSPPEQMIWKRAYEFKSDSSIKNLQNYEFRHHFLPPKILGIMSKIFKIEFFLFSFIYIIFSNYNTVEVEDCSTCTTSL